MSDQDDNIFSGDKPQEAAPAVINPPSEFVMPDLVADLIGDGRKYKTIEDALKSIPNAQAHIEKIEGENAELRISSEKVSNIDSMLEKIEANQNQGTTTPTVEFDPNSVAAIVDDRLKLKDEQNAKNLNTQSVIDAMRNQYGEKASETFNRAATDNGLSVAELNALCQTSPKAALKLIGVNETVSLPLTSNGSVNTESLKPAEPELSAKVPKGATTADMTNAWNNAGKKVQQRNK